MYGFNGYGSYIGMSEGGKVDDADYVSFTLDQATPVSPLSMFRPLLFRC